MQEKENRAIYGCSDQIYIAFSRLVLPIDERLCVCDCSKTCACTVKDFMVMCNMLLIELHLSEPGRLDVAGSVILSMSDNDSPVTEPVWRVELCLCVCKPARASASGTKIGYRHLLTWIAVVVKVDH